MKKTPETTNLFLKTGIFTLILLVVTSQAAYDQASPPFTTKFIVQARNILPEKILPYVTFGFTNAIVDYYWISATQDFTGWNYKDTFFINYFRNIATLDPKFEYPYLFAIFALPQSKEDLDVIAPISEKGIKENPNSWAIPFYLGTKYYTFTKKNKPADTYLEIASRVQNAPTVVRLFYSSFIARTITGERVNAALLRVIYNNTDDETIKRIAAKGLQESLIIQMLERGIAAYKAKFKKFPRTIEDMNSFNLISLPQGFTDGFTIIINQYDGSFKILEKK
jgi:hypothetical protein